LDTPSYQRFFCDQIFRARELFKRDEKTANYINHMDDAVAVLEKIVSDLKVTIV